MTYTKKLLIIRLYEKLFQLNNEKTKKAQFKQWAKNAKRRFIDEMEMTRRH